ncbi:taperin [Rhinoderma darwinii]|uniref:taperin n=1 Tax=Rhinoderma darwinii TaxID=43563 RepID=UPI003F67E328
MAVSGGSTKSWPRPEPHSHKIPAWKLEVLERKRAKMASAAVSRGKDSSPSRKTRSPSRQSRNFSPERLVLQDSLGPLHENPFIKQEKERRRHRRPHHPHHSPGRASSPIRHLLDMYSHLPGMRTIRAENIIIIESDPGYFSHSVSGHGDPVEELLAKRGNKVAEIRASEVVIYEPEVPNKEPPKKVPAPPKKESLEHTEVLEEAGRVSRLLEKFDHGHSRPARSRSLETLLERDSKPTILPKPPILELQGQAPLNRSPKRSGEFSSSSAFIIEEDSKRFPLNNPSWLPSKPPIPHSLPDPDLFHKRPSSPMMSPASVAPLSPSLPLSPTYETSMGDQPLSPTVATVREKFEVGHTSNNVPPPLPKLVNVTQKVGNNTILVNPKAVPTSKGKSPTTDGEGLKRDCPPLTNGLVDHLEKNVKTGTTISIQDLLSKSKRPKGTVTQRVPEGSGPVPSNESMNEIPNGTISWRPKCEVDPPKSSSIPPKSSATSKYPSITNHCDQAFTSATPSQQLKVSASTSSNDSFEIRPAPKPDLRSIPDDDVQAKALANIRMQSKNSFVFIPKKRQVPSVTQQDVQSKPKVRNSATALNGPKSDRTDSPKKNGDRTNDVRVPATPQDGTGTGDVNSSKTVRSASGVPSLSDFDWKSGLLPSRSPTEGQSFTDLGAELEYFSSVQQGDGVVVLTDVPVTKIHEDAVKPDIPVTNIDDIVNIEDKEVNKETKPAFKTEESPYRPHSAVSSIRNKGGNTFTVVPKRKPVTEQEAFRTPVVEDDEDDDPRSKRKSSDGSEAPYSELGALLKKRYPTADEIQVIGGYQSLSKSCLTKIGSTRKKMKISFNEQNIHTMFEYPSEDSVGDEMGEDEVSGSDSEDDDKPSGLFLPRPQFVSGGASSNGLRANSANSGLSNYTPKHSVEYSKWQDEASLGGSTTQDIGASSGDMLTPADSNSHMGFRSEPALYF